MSHSRSHEHDHHHEPHAHQTAQGVADQAHHIASQAYATSGRDPGLVAAHIAVHDEPLLSEIMFHIQRDHGNHFAAAVEKALKKMTTPDASTDLMIPALDDSPEVVHDGAGDDYMTPKL